MPTTRPESWERLGASTGGAWHPDSPRIGVPGILSGREAGSEKVTSKRVKLTRARARIQGNT
jgi:hypothetical protein